MSLHTVNNGGGLSKAILLDTIIEEICTNAKASMERLFTFGLDLSPPIETFLRMTVILLARSRPR